MKHKSWFQTVKVHSWKEETVICFPPIFSQHKVEYEDNPLMASVYSCILPQSLLPLSSPSNRPPTTTPTLLSGKYYSLLFFIFPYLLSPVPSCQSSCRLWFGAVTQPPGSGCGGSVRWLVYGDVSGGVTPNKPASPPLTPASTWKAPVLAASRLLWLYESLLTWTRWFVAFDHLTVSAEDWV